MSKEDPKRTFDRQGYVLCQSFAKSRIDEILGNLDRVFLDVVPAMPSDHVFYEDKSDVCSLKQLQRLHDHDEYFGKLMTEGSFRRLAESLLGEPVVCQNMQFFNKPPGIGQPTPPHQDGFYFKLDPPNALTMWMALEPVDEDNGCVRYVSKSHLAGMRPHGSTGTLGFSQGITDFSTTDESQEIAILAEAGDLLVHHALTIHRAGGNSSQTRSRRALGFIYYGESAKVDVVAQEKYQSELKAELIRTGKI